MRIDDKQDEAHVPEAAQAQAQEQTPAPASVDAANLAPDPETEKVLMLIDTMEPGESKHLAQLLTSHPNMREAILAKAAEVLGNDTVAKALELLTGASVDAQPTPEVAPEAPPPPAMDKAQEALLFNLSILEPGDFKLLAKILGEHPEMHDAIIAEATKWVGAETVAQALDLLIGVQAEPQAEPTPPEAVVETAATATQTAEAPKPVEEEAGWVVRARAYNGHHHRIAAEFNQLTSGACIGANGQLDPNLIATWQASHGVEPDGRVGENTLQAARAGSEPAASQAPVPEPEPAEQPPAG